MKDKRPVDELSIEDLELVLLVRKRESRMKRYREQGNRCAATSVPAPIVQPSTPQFQVVPHTQETTVELPAQSEPIPYDAAQDALLIEDDGVPRFEDDFPPAVVYLRQNNDYPNVIGYANHPQRQSWLGRAATNKLLLLVEVSAIVGLLLLLVVAFQGIATVNTNIEKTDQISATSEAQMALRQVQPTATPLISVSQVVLPGGHIWDENGEHRFNMAEVPAPFREAFQQQLNAPRTEITDVPVGGPIRVQIPSINVDASVRSGDDWISLQAGVGYLPGSGKLGEKGNMVLAGHNDIFGEVFRYIENLNPGEEVRVQSTNGRWFTYVVREKQIVDPSEVWVLDQSLGSETPLATLITCYPYRVNTHRIVVFAELVEEP